MQWDDLKIALALAESGSVAGAARSLGVTASTINRRLAHLEAALGVRLFERLRAGIQPTAPGSRLLAHAQLIKQQAADLELSVLGGDQKLVGAVSLTCSSPILRLIESTLADCVIRYPGVELLVRTEDALANLQQREADVAVRITARPPEALLGRRLCNAAFGVYGHREYLASPPAVHRLVAEDDGQSQPIWATGHVATRANHLNWTLAAVRHQLGLGRLPCFMADVHPELERVGPLLTGPTFGVWILTHERLKQVARVRALVDAITEALSRHIDLFEGRHHISAS